MAYSYQEHVGNGTTGPYSYGSVALLDAAVESIADQLDVYKNGVLLTVTTNYTINTTAKTITLVSTPAYSTDVIRIARNTKKDARYVDYVDSTNVTSELLDLDSNQLFFTMQEAYDIQNDSMVRDVDGLWNGKSYRIKNISNGVNGTDAVTMNQLNAAIEGGLPATLAGYGTQAYKGNGVDREFALPPAIYDVANPEDFEVYINGIRLLPTTQYTISGTNFKLQTGVTTPTSTDEVLLSFPQGSVSAVLTANSVSTTALQDDCVTVAKIAAGANGTFLKTVSLNPTWSTIAYTDVSNFATGVATVRLDQMAAPTADISLNSNKITNLSTPTTSNEAANKSYVDAQVAAVVTTGTWTPSLRFGGNNVGITTSSLSGTYTKIGRLVFITGTIGLSSKGSSTGAASIEGLPFTPASAVYPLIGVFYSNGPTAADTSFIDPSSPPRIRLMYENGQTAFTNTNFNNNTGISFSGCYIT